MSLSEDGAGRAPASGRPSGRRAAGRAATTFLPMSSALSQQNGTGAPVGGLGPVKGPDVVLPGSQQLAPVWHI